MYLVYVVHYLHLTHTQKLREAGLMPLVELIPRVPWSARGVAAALYRPTGIGLFFRDLDRVTGVAQAVADQCDCFEGCYSAGAD